MLYIVKVQDHITGEIYEYEYGCIEHAQAHLAAEKDPAKLFIYDHGVEEEIQIKKL